MTDNVANHTHELLKQIQAGQTLIRNELADMRRDLRDGFADVHVQLTALGQQVGGLTTAVYSGHSRIDTLEKRIERIERRLELRDETTP
jgi:predicted RNase H-like nuclease (RuvC/YqgF family)